MGFDPSNLTNNRRTKLSLTIDGSKPHPDDHTIRTTDTPGFKPFTIANFLPNFFQYFDFVGFSLSHWYTYYRSCQGDRLHHFKCTRTPAYGRHPTCAWTNYLNNPRQYYFRACTNNAYIAGVLSYYDQHTSDRRYCEGREGDTKASHSPRASRPVVRRSSTRGQGRRWLWERDCYYSDVCCTLSVTRN